MPPHLTEKGRPRSATHQQRSSINRSRVTFWVSSCWRETPLLASEIARKEWREEQGREQKKNTRTREEWRSEDGLTWRRSKVVTKFFRDPLLSPSSVYKAHMLSQRYMGRARHRARRHLKWSTHCHSPSRWASAPDGPTQVKLRLLLARC